jgi:hypothetical protein
MGDAGNHTFIETRVADGGEVVSPTRRPHFIAHTFSASHTHFFQGLNKFQGPMRPE